MPLHANLPEGVNGSPVGYLSATAPPGDTASANAPFVQSPNPNGLLLQGLAGTPTAYLWSTPPAGQPRTDHFYATDGTVPEGYTDEGIAGYIRSTTATGTVPLIRYVNGATGSHFFSATGTDVPSGYTADGAGLGYADTANPAGDLVPLARHYNATTADYLLDTSTTPPPGYTYQATLGYIRPTVGNAGATIATVYTRNTLGQVTPSLHSLCEITGALVTGRMSPWWGPRSYEI